MALTEKTIKSGKIGTRNMRDECARLLDNCNSISSAFDSNVDYKAFATDTDYGKMYDTNFRNLIKQLKDVELLINDLSKRVDTYLDKQEQLNNKAI